jgi:hypothetical protein
MLGEFVHESRVYCIKSVLDPVTLDEKKINFKSLEDAKNFFAYVASNPFSREELLEVTKWLRPAPCRPPKNCPKPTEQELLEMLCLMVYEDGLRGDYRLVELEAPKPTLKFEECCIRSMKHIERIVDNTKLIGPVLLIAEVVMIFASHTGTPGLISALSAAYNTAIQTDWKMLAEAMASLSQIQRKSIFKTAEIEYQKHYEAEMNRVLGKYWKGIMDAAA